MKGELGKTFATKLPSRRVGSAMAHSISKKPTKLELLKRIEHNISSHK